MRRLLPAFALFFAITIGASVPAAAEDVVPRTIIALYEGGPVQNSYIHTVAEMPLNYLGLTVEYYDIHEPLPDIAHRKDVRGVISWFYGDAYDHPEVFLKWALDAMAAGKKFVIIGSLGVPDDPQHFAVSTLSSRFLERLGLKRPARWTGDALDISYDYRTPSMFLTPDPYTWLRPSYEAMQPTGDPHVQIHLLAHRPNSNPDEDAALIVTGPNGGFLDADYAIRANKHEGQDVTQWLVNPFEFFRLAFATDDLPKPDVSTIAGRRIYYSNIDGDGWNNVTQLEEYRGKHVLSAQVILDKVIKPFPDLPVMVAPIAGDVDTDWVGTEESRRVAREIWAQPQVEPGSHTYSHPFYWEFFEDGDVQEEVPYLKLYKTPTWQPEGGIADAKMKSPELPVEFTVPRAFANEPFDLEKEIGGSLKELSTLLPKGKKIDILSWSGDCMPWEEVVHLTREAHVLNINGGDARFDPEYPAYASVAPVGRQVGKERQIYNSSSNENTYTDLWVSNFHAFAYLKKTIDNTNMPLRLSAMSIYYHIYSGEKEAGLNALLSNLRYARTLDIAPITAGHYARIADSFYQTQLISTGNDSWRVEKHGALNTIRFDRATMKAVDFDRSHGVIGQRHINGSLYVYLDDDTAQPVIALKDDPHYYAPPEAPIAYLLESRWTVAELQREQNRLDFTAQGYGAGDMIWRVPNTGFYRITVNGKSQKVEVAADHLLKFKIDDNAIDAVHVTITEAPDASNIARTVSALCVLAAGTVAAALYLAPSHTEIALMQMNDFNFNTAFKAFSALHNEGDSSINVLAPLVNLNIYYGDVDKAIALLEVYVADHPRSLEARKKLADLYKSSERFDLYCNTLEEIQDLSPSAATLEKLVENYAFLGRTHDEMHALERLIDSDGYQPEENDYLRLASYYRVDHQADKAINTISDYIEDHHYHVSLESITLVVQLLQEAGKEDDALSMAKAFLRKQPREDDAIMLSTLFEAHDQFASAYDVLKPFLGDMDHSVDLEQQVADLMLEMKKDDELYDLLVAQRTKQGSLAPSLAVTLTDLAVTRADYDTLEALIRTQDLEKMPELALLRFADMSFRLKRPDLAQIMQSKLTAEYFHQAPLLEAVLAVASNDTPKTMAALAALPKDVISSSQDKLIVAEIYLQHDQRAPAFALLDSMSVDDVLDSFDAEQYAELYLDMGAAAKAEQALAAARPNSAAEIQDAIDQTLVLLAAGSGKTDFIRQKLADFKPGDLWPDAYDFALHYNHNELALLIAEKLFQYDPNPSNRLQYAEALMNANRFVEALKNLEPLVESNDDARSMYLDAIATWAEQSGGVQGMSEQQRTTLNAVVASAMKNKSMPLDERRDLAYVLEDIGFYPEAESVLIALAGNQPAGNSDVEELLAFWSDHPSPMATSWVADRARHSSGSDQALWLTYLNDNEQSQVVLDVLGDGSDLSPAVAEQYIEALVEIKNKTRLASALEEYIDAETNFDRLKKLVTTAAEEDVDAAAEKGWRKVLSINQNDNDAAKAVGIIDYDAGNYDEAEPLLKQYLDYNQNDYEVDLAYGEILQQDDRKSEADLYFQHALQLISAIHDQDKGTRVDEAYLLYSTNHIAESLALFRQLIAQYPDDKEIRADLAEVLTEMGRFDEAAGLLSQ